MKIDVRLVLKQVKDTYCCICLRKVARMMVWAVMAEHTKYKEKTPGILLAEE